ncbi:hypothetical protein [[Mycoplasma] mobile]|nr:hypothetical protein [[Mycoplasma] mobile]
MKKCKIKRNANGELFCKTHPITMECPTINPSQDFDTMNVGNNQANNYYGQYDNQVDNNQMINGNGNYYQEEYPYDYNTQNLNTQQGYYSNQNDDLSFGQPSMVDVTGNMPSSNYNAQNFPVVDYTQVVDTNNLVPSHAQHYPTQLHLGTAFVPAVNNFDSTTQNLLVRESMGVATQNQDAIISQLSNNSIEKLNTLNFLLESGVITYNDYFIKKRDLYFNEFEKDDSSKK